MEKEAPFNDQLGPDDDVNPQPRKCSLCTGDTKDNIFFVPRAPGFPGRCVLDELTYGQVYQCLRSVPRARKDLLRVTHDPTLQSIGKEVALEQDEIEDDKAAADLINKKGTLPFYTLFKGNQFGGF